MSDSNVGVPGIALGPSVKAPFMSDREVAVADDMVTGVLRARWGSCRCRP